MDELTQMTMFDPPKRQRTQPERKCVGKVLMLGGGRQSSGLAEMSVEGELPLFDLVLFADTYDEPKYVYQQVDYLRSRLALVESPLVVVKHSSEQGLMEYTRDLSHSRYAKMPLYVPDAEKGYRQLPRQCTKEFKIEPCDRYMRQWLVERGYGKADKRGANRVDQRVYVEVMFGFGADEAYRVNRKPFNVGWKRKAFPLYDAGITTARLMEWFEAKGLPQPKKSSCIQCPYHDDAYWLDMKLNSPDDFERACAFDDWLRTPEARRIFLRGVRDLCYLHSSCVPLREVDFENWRWKSKVNPLQMALLFQNACGVDGFSCES